MKQRLSLVHKTELEEDQHGSLCNLAQRDRRYIVLKNNKGSEDNRVRKLDYSIQISKLFYERFISDDDITLFFTHEVQVYMTAFGTEEFDKLYLKYEKDTSIFRKKVPAQKLFFDLLKERAETGRIYIMNIDHANSHSSFKDKVNMSNLCQGDYITY